MGRKLFLPGMLFFLESQSYLCLFHLFHYFETYSIACYFLPVIRWHAILASRCANPTWHIIPGVLVLTWQDIPTGHVVPTLHVIPTWYVMLAARYVIHTWHVMLTDRYVIPTCHGYAYSQLCYSYLAWLLVMLAANYVIPTWHVMLTARYVFPTWHVMLTAR